MLLLSLHVHFSPSDNDPFFPCRHESSLYPAKPETTLRSSLEPPGRPEGAGTPKRPPGLGAELGKNEPSGL